ncbi:MAG: type II toxin-antitoxin system Phd/YefM family antitoxin [Pseudonocardia sp.]
MPETIGQRQLRRVEAGESFIITRNGRPIADLVPHHGAPSTKRLTLRWYADRGGG